MAAPRVACRATSLRCTRGIRMRSRLFASAVSSMAPTFPRTIPELTCDKSRPEGPGENTMQVLCRRPSRCVRGELNGRGDLRSRVGTDGQAHRADVARRGVQDHGVE